MVLTDLRNYSLHDYNFVCESVVDDIDVHSNSWDT